MARLLDIIVASTTIILLLPTLLMIQGLLALNREPVMRQMQLLNLDRLPLIFRVLQGKLTISEWLRHIS